MLVACSRCRAPRSSRAPTLICVATKSATSSSSSIRISRAKRPTISRRMAKSGSWRLQTSPLASRETSSLPSGCSSPSIRSLASTIWRPSVSRASNVCSSSSSEARLPDEELNVIQQQQVGPATLLPEAGQARAAERFDKAGDELLGRQIDGSGTRMRCGDTRRGSPATGASCRRP